MFLDTIKKVALLSQGYRMLIFKTNRSSPRGRPAQHYRNTQPNSYLTYKKALNLI